MICTLNGMLLKSTARSFAFELICVFVCVCVICFFAYLSLIDNIVV